MSQRLRSLLMAPLTNNEDRINRDQLSDIEKLKAQPFQINMYLFLCFLIASLLWISVCYLLYRLVRGFNLNMHALAMDNYDALEESSEYTSSCDTNSNPTRWQRLVRFARRKTGIDEGTSQLQLIHVGLIPKTQSLPVLVNLSGKSCVIGQKSLDQS